MKLKDIHKLLPKEKEIIEGTLENYRGYNDADYGYNQCLKECKEILGKVEFDEERCIIQAKQYCNKWYTEEELGSEWADIHDEKFGCLIGFIKEAIKEGDILKYE